MQQLIAPGSEVGGNSRLELPPPSRVMAEARTIDSQVRGAPTSQGARALRACRARQTRPPTPSPPLPSPPQEYLLLAFPSETVTRSGYQVRRKHLAVVACRRGTAYALDASARSDQWGPAKQALLQRVVDSFRLR